ncbi:hypothetical protein CSUI_005390, partial [Cystoisospora suis]
EREIGSREFQVYVYYIGPRSVYRVYMYVQLGLVLIECVVDM